jgi:hypothetical protein
MSIEELARATLFGITRRCRLVGGIDVGDSTSERVTVCSVCEKPVVRPGQNAVTINERVYHANCWERLHARRTRT